MHISGWSSLKNCRHGWHSMYQCVLSLLMCQIYSIKSLLSCANYGWHRLPLLLFTIPRRTHPMDRPQRSKDLTILRLQMTKQIMRSSVSSDKKVLRQSKQSTFKYCVFSAALQRLERATFFDCTILTHEAGFWSSPTVARQFQKLPIIKMTLRRRPATRIKNRARKIRSASQRIEVRT